jgi:hypothetical protein
MWRILRVLKIVNHNKVKFNRKHDSRQQISYQTRAQIISALDRLYHVQLKEIVELLSRVLRVRNTIKYEEQENSDQNHNKVKFNRKHDSRQQISYQTRAQNISALDRLDHMQLSEIVELLSRVLRVRKTIKYEEKENSDQKSKFLL